jgi:L-threonylcarbamoyladenylate synthase
MACDTIYGILGRVPDTLEQIRTIKGRGDTQPFLQLLASPGEVRHISPMAIPSDLLKLWPGPVTFVLPDRSGGTVACRVPNDLYLRQIIKKAGVPLYSTSVNRSGEPSEWKITRIIELFGAEVGAILDDGDLNGRQPSTLLDLTVKPYRVIRQGVLILPEKLVAKYGIMLKNGG